MTLFKKRQPQVEVLGLSLPSMDLTREGDVQALSELFDSRTAVIMCAGKKKQLGDTLENFTQNLKMVVNICNLLSHRPVKRFLYFSSAEVYGVDISEPRVTEDTPVRPMSYYGIGKYASECVLQTTVQDQKNTSLLILRPPLVYGPGDKSRGYGPSGFLWAAVNSRKITLWGDGSELRDFVYVEDIAQIVRQLTFHKFTGVVNIATGRSSTFRETLEIVARMAPARISIDSRARTKPKVNIGFDNSLLLKLLPNLTFTPLDEGLHRTLDAELSLLEEPGPQKIAKGS